MTTTTRQERRAKLKAEMAKTAKSGMQADAEGDAWWWPVAAEARHLIDIFRGNGANRASAAALHAHGFYDRATKASKPDGQPACAKGCSLCCTCPVTANAPEIFAVANHVRRTRGKDWNAVLEKMRVADRDTRYRDMSQPHVAPYPCPMLGPQGECTVYEARPSACRALVSSSLQGCQQAFSGKPVPVPRLNMWWSLRAAHVYALEAAMAANNLPTYHYAFIHALRIALEDETAEQRWLNGEDVFASVVRDREEAKEPAQDREARLAKLIAGAMAQE